MQTIGALSRNLSMMQKGILLAGAPLAFVVLLLSALLILLHVTEADRDRQQHAREVILASEQLKRLFVAAGLTTIQYYTSRGQSLDRRSEVILEQIPRKVNALKSLVADNARQSSRMAAVDKLCRQLIGLLDEMQTSLERSGSVEVFVSSSEVQYILMDCLKQILAILDEITEAEQQVVDRSRPLGGAQNQHVKAAVAAGIALTFLLSLAMTLFYHRSTIKRLDVLMNNTQRLLRGTELNPVLVGNDEIAHLDRTFHEMTRTLREMEQLKQDFFRMISHDLRSPLTSIQVTLNLLETGGLGQLTEKGMTEVARSEKQVKRLVSLISELLDIQKLDSGQLEMNFEWCELAPLLREAAEAVHGLAVDKNMEVILPEADVDVFVDGGRLVQVLVNLLANAIKFSPPGSKIAILFRADAEFVTFGVKDSGRGIPPHLSQAIFDRFRQVEESDSVDHGGSGLGLYICKMIVAAHGGTIWVESESSNGSTFWFKIPAERS